MIKKTIALVQQVDLTQISYSFDEACLNPVAVSKKTPQFYSLCGFFLLNGPMISQVKEMKWQKNSTSQFFLLVSSM